MMANNATTACSMQEVTFAYRKNKRIVRVLEKTGFQGNQGDFISIRGASGSGKSTLLFILGGLLKPQEGDVRVEEVEPYRQSPKERARLRARRIGFVFQQFHLIPYLSVRENILVQSWGEDSGGGSGGTLTERALELAETFGISHRLNHGPADLSVGEMQRTALARALLHRPALVLADEPTGNLDEDNAVLVMDALKSFARQGGCVVMVTHDSRLADRAPRRLRLEEGALIEEGG